ncbi:MAG: adenylate kinase [Firmicutes bacterium]|nr:adenylate kinase [Bacillota bacterium]MDD4262995.1 adenylate kinase [Bacillota bacterium]MDD4693356.1 adenylate kinase [Bacillota bacterium]
MRLVILGAPGAGKGTQASLLAEFYHCPHVSTGDIFRKAIAEDTQMGREADRHISQGRLVPDEITIELVKQRIEEPDCQYGFVLDGYPRTQNQAVRLDEILRQKCLYLNKAIQIELGEDEIYRRLANRRVCTDCGATYHLDSLPPKTPGICDLCGSALIQRDDDNDETIKERIIVYHKLTEPVLSYYKKQGSLLVTSGEGDILDVHKTIINSLETRSLRANDSH